VPTEILSAESADSAPAEEPTAKELVTPSEPQNQLQGSAEPSFVIPIAWQIALLILGLVSGMVMLALGRSAKQKWK
jgi:hypothetical protein